MTNVFIYGRVSTTKQADNGDSIDEQVDTLFDYCVDNYNVDPFGIFIDAGVSGSIGLLSRPEGSELLKAVQSGDLIIATRLDRLFRSVIDGLTSMNTLNDLGIKVRCMDLGIIDTTTAIGRLQFTNALAVAEYELMKSKERTASVKQFQRKSGAFCGGSVPIGKQVVEVNGKRAVVDSEEDLEMIAIILELKKNKLSSREIASYMNEKHNFPISYRSVLRIIERESTK